MMMTGDAPSLLIRREWLGLTTSWLAAYLGVGRRTLHRWEAGGHMSESALRRLDELERFTDNAVRELAAGLAASRAEGWGALTIPIYRDGSGCGAVLPDGRELPAAWHRRVVARVKERVPEVAVEWAA